jgi:antitoxin component YwqK of YwqJK toxin-antitoxin module
VLNFAGMIALTKRLLLAGFCLSGYFAHTQPAALLESNTGVASFFSEESYPGVQKPLPYELPVSGIITTAGTGQPLFTATVKRGKLNGEWQSWFSNGVVCDSGRLVNNLPDGAWVFRNEKGEITGIRHYNADKFLRITNEMQHYHPKRSFYYLATLYQKNKRRALHYLDAGYSFPGSIFPKPVSTLQQLAESNTSSGTTYHPVFLQCVHEGLYMNYFSGGMVKDSGMYKDGMKSGKWIHRDTLQAGWFQGAYKHGLPVKEWKHFDQEGRLVEVLHYDQSGRLSWRKKINRQPSR